MIEWLFALAGLIIALRAVLGPTFADRLLAANLIVNIVTVFMVLHAVNIGADIYLDIAILLSLLSLVGTLAVAKYVVGAK
jgi:multicomponent Na+:H+ antiporter subunit F